MRPAELAVRKVGRPDTTAVAATLAQAFENDRVMRWLVPGEGRLEPAFTLYLEQIWLAHDACFATTDGLAAACWLPPGQWRLGAGRRLALLPRLAGVMGRDLPRMANGLRVIEARHPRKPHWYLPLVGVVPEAQGRGRGAALLRHMLDRCDGEGTPAYLEATTERSRALYAMHGFEVTEELRLPGGGPPLWPMWREPGARLG